MKVTNLLTKEITEILIKNQLLEILIKKEILSVIIDKILLTKEEESNIIKMIYDKEKLSSESDFNEWLKNNNTNKEDFLNDISRPIKINKYCLSKFSHKTETIFLEKKDMLSTVTYSLIRVKDLFQAQELYLRVKEEPQTFGDLAKQFSLGTEKDSQGCVGPIQIAKGHPTVNKILTTSKIGEVNIPFKVEEFWVVLRLESLNEAKLDENMKLELSKQLFEKELSQQTSIEISNLQKSFSINQTQDN
tara:strand:+ start:2839 stop:3579 length:741 start_codon:yes stop_codon:yes gene_type:complete